MQNETNFVYLLFISFNNNHPTKNGRERTHTHSFKLSAININEDDWSFLLHTNVRNDAWSLIRNACIARLQLSPCRDFPFRRFIWHRDFGMVNRCFSWVWSFFPAK
mmetsp:Transcript_1902/g.3597  ORF Transcript_1902/g.3597 Transcript_1902/m.3597 type:complete len:106 (+) Transcript_1902:510-827(+)